MSNTPIQDPAAQGPSSGSGRTLPSRPLQPTTDSSASKRVCFYKSGDHKFSGHRMVISARTFKTFDALLDALSKKVPLPFGVRTITTPRGTRLVKGLDDLNDGGAYVCSDQRRVKPLNMNEVSRHQIPWNTTRPLSARRQRRLHPSRFSGMNNVAGKSSKVNKRLAVRTPKRFMVIKNKDPTVKCTIVLHRRTAPTFDALLDYLSEILHFPVLKLFSTDGRRVDGLAALILCSGVVVAAGNEPFRLGNYGFHRSSQMAQVMHVETVETSVLPPIAPKENNKSLSSRKGVRNFSLSSEQYIVNQINKTQNGGMNSHLHQHNGSFETEVSQRHTSIETCGTGHHSRILPHEDDIEKSFCVNQDGSMTVEMKVHLTIKEKETLHWTTTLSRASLSKRTVHASISGNSSPDSNNAVAKSSSRISEDVTKEENRPTGSGKGVCFHGEQVCDDNTLRKVKSSVKRAPTPGPRQVRKKASVESVKMVTESGVKESSLGHYSYTERTAGGETTEGYCVVRHSSSSSRSNRPIPNPRKAAPAGATDKGSSVRSSGGAEVLQIDNNAMEVTETVMRIYESQGCYENYFANRECSRDGVPSHGPDSEPSSETRPHSSSNDIDFSRQPSPADSLQRLKGEMLSLSSETMYSTRENTNNLSTMNDNEATTATNSQIEGAVKKAKTPQSGKNKKVTKRGGNDTHVTSKNSKRSSTDKLNNNVSVGKKSLSSSESAKSKKEKKIEKSQSKKSIKKEKTPRKDSALMGNTEKVKNTLSTRQSTDKVAAKYNGHNVNTPTGRPQMKKNMSDILQPKRSGKKTVSKPKSVTEKTALSPKKPLNDSVSMPSLNPTASEIHQYVENWLENVSQDHVPYIEAAPGEPEPQSKVVFQVGGDSDSDEKNESQIGLAEHDPPSADAVQKSVSPHREGPETTNSNATSNHETNGLPDFSTQVASAFGSSFKSFMSFLSVMILRDNLKESVLGDDDPSRSSSEAVLMMQSLLKMSAIEDKERQKACLTDLQSRASSHFTTCWKDFQILRDRLESGPLSPELSQSKFALEVVSEGGAIFEDQHPSVDELMQELNMPKDLRAEMYSTIQQAKSLYLMEESTSGETERNQTDSVPSADGARSAEPGDTSGENIAEDVRKTGPDENESKVSPTGKHVVLDVTQHESAADEDQIEEADERGEGQKAGEDGDEETNEGEELENMGQEREEEEGRVEAHDEVQTDSEGEKGSDEERVGKMKGGTEEETTDEEGEELGEAGRGVVEETDEREGAEETEEGEEGTDGVREKTDEGDNDENQVDETEDETEKLVEKTHETVVEEQEVEKNEEKFDQMTDEEVEEEELENNDSVEEKEEVDEEEAEKEELEHVFGEKEDEEEEMDAFTEQGNEDRDKMELDREESDEEDEGDCEATRVEKGEQEEEEENIKGPKEMERCPEEHFEANEVEESETEEDVKGDEESQVEEQESFFPSKEEGNGVCGDEDSFDDDEEGKNLLDEASYLQQNGTELHEKANSEHNTESPAQTSSGGQCEHPKHGGTDNEFGTDEEGQCDEERNAGLLHPVEISQELLDFVNMALQSSSLIFTYDARGNIRLEPDNARGVQTKEILIPKSRKDSLYGSKCLPSPSTSDLSDYRPETSESGGYKTQESVDIVTDSGEEVPVYRDENNGETSDRRATSKLSLGSNVGRLQSPTLRSAECFSSSDSGAKASYFSGETSVKADVEDVPEATPHRSSTSGKDTSDGVLIDRGRWLLKENHLMRRSPPFSQGMYGDEDSTSTDSDQEKTSEGSPTRRKTQQNPLVAISSSDLEEMSKPQTPKCNYFNMPHGSDSDPFLDNSSVLSGKKQTLSVKGRDFRVSPTVDTTKTWPNKSGSLSSFASVEFKMPDGKVHPEAACSAVAQPRQTSSGGRRVLQAQDSVDALHMRCGQYCPIL